MWLAGILVAVLVGGTIITAFLSKFLFVVSLIMFALALIGIGDVTYAQAGYTLLASVLCGLSMLILSILLGALRTWAES